MEPVPRQIQSMEGLVMLIESWTELHLKKELFSYGASDVPLGFSQFGCFLACVKSVSCLPPMGLTRVPISCCPTSHKHMPASSAPFSLFAPWSLQETILFPSTSQTTKIQRPLWDLGTEIPKGGRD